MKVKIVVIILVLLTQIFIIYRYIIIK